jgi:hypothetical protein
MGSLVMGNFQQARDPRSGELLIHLLLALRRDSVQGFHPFHENGD